MEADRRLTSLVVVFSGVALLMKEVMVLERGVWDWGDVRPGRITDLKKDCVRFNSGVDWLVFFCNLMTKEKRK